MSVNPSSKNLAPAQFVPLEELRWCDVIRVPLKDLPEKVTVVVLNIDRNTDDQIISLDVFPVETMAQGEKADKASCFTIESQGYKEQMGLPFTENFKINFMPITLNVHGIGEVDKIGYVGMGNVKDVMRNEFRERLDRSSDGKFHEFTVPYFFGEKPQELPPEKKAKAPKAENPTLRQLAERGELSEFARWVFSGEKDGQRAAPVLDKKGKPLLDADQKPVVVKTLSDLNALFNDMGGEAGIAKNVRNMGAKSAADVSEEIKAALKLYPG